MSKHREQEMLNSLFPDQSKFQLASEPYCNVYVIPKQSKAELTKKKRERRMVKVFEVVQEVLSKCLPSSRTTYESTQAIISIYGCSAASHSIGMDNRGSVSNMGCLMT